MRAIEKFYDYLFKASHGDPLSGGRLCFNIREALVVCNSQCALSKLWELIIWTEAM